MVFENGVIGTVGIGKLGCDQSDGKDILAQESLPGKGVFQGDIAGAPDYHGKLLDRGWGYM